MDELFDTIQREVQGAGFGGKLNAGVVLAGGGASLGGIAELAADVFGVGVRIGAPGARLEGLVEVVRDPCFATVAGIAMYGATQFGPAALTARRAGLGGVGVDRLASRVKTWFQDFF